MYLIIFRHPDRLVCDDTQNDGLVQRFFLQCGEFGTWHPGWGREIAINSVSKENLRFRYLRLSSEIWNLPRNPRLRRIERSKVNFVRRSPTKICFKYQQIGVYCVEYLSRELPRRMLCDAGRASWRAGRAAGAGRPEWAGSGAGWPNCSRPPATSSHQGGSGLKAF